MTTADDDTYTVEQDTQKKNKMGQQNMNPNILRLILEAPHFANKNSIGTLQLAPKDVVFLQRMNRTLWLQHKGFLDLCGMTMDVASFPAAYWACLLHQQRPAFFPCARTQAVLLGLITKRDKQ